jgi:hypothetical protein
VLLAAIRQSPSTIAPRDDLAKSAKADRTIWISGTRTSMNELSMDSKQIHRTHVMPLFAIPVSIPQRRDYYLDPTLNLA